MTLLSGLSGVYTAGAGVAGPQRAGASALEGRPMSERLRWASLAAVAATLTITAAACGGSSSSGLSSESPSQVLAAAVAATKAATSYEVGSAGSFSGGISSFDLKVKGTSISGSFVMNGATIQLVEVADNVYIKAPASFYTAAGASSAGAVLLGAAWVEITAGSSYSSDFSSLSNLTDVSSQLANAGTVTSDGTGTVDGQSVVFIKNAGGTVLAVASSGTAYPVEVKETGASAGTYNLSNWNSIPAVTAPPNPLQLPSS